MPQSASPAGATSQQDRYGAWVQRFALLPRAWAWGAIALGLAIFAAQWARVIAKPVGDFKLHWVFGARMLRGDWIYAGGHDIPYLPFWALAHAPLTIVPMHAAQVLLFPLSLVALVSLIWVLRRMTVRWLPVARGSEFWVAALAVLLASRFVIRDQIECGVNLALVALSWLGVWLWSERREKLGGFCVGLGIALKCTPALFLLYFAWKREWRMTGWTMAFAALLILSPVAVMGWHDYHEATVYWTKIVWDGASATDLSQGVLGPEPSQNMSLKTALARWVDTVPVGHVARIDHPLYAEFLNLPPVLASAIVNGLLLAGLGAVAWRLRGPAPKRRSEVVAWECAIVSVLILLYSPLTWGQHCVGTIPMLYLLVRSSASHGRLPRATRVALGLFVVGTLVLNRGILGKDLTWVLESYRVQTWCLVGLVVGGLVAHRQALRWNLQFAEFDSDVSGPLTEARRETLSAAPSVPVVAEHLDRVA